MLQNFLKNIQNSAWQTILAFIGIVIAIFIYQDQKNRTSLSYRIVSSVPIVNEVNVPSKVGISFENKELSFPYISQIEIKNTGNKDISPNEIFEPIEISVRGYSQNGKDTCLINNVDLVTNFSNQTKLSSEIKNFETPVSFEIDKFLLNSGESFSVSILTSNCQRPNFSFKFRIAGVQKIEEISERNINLSFGAAALALLLSTFISPFLIQKLGYSKNQRFVLKLGNVLFSTVSATLLSSLFIYLLFFTWQALFTFP